MDNLEWTKRPSWSKHDVYEKEMEWVRYLAREAQDHIRLESIKLGERDMIELSWLGLYTHVAKQHHKELLKQATKNNIESHWLLLSPYGNKEYAHLAAVATKGPSLYPLQPAVFREHEDKDVAVAFKALSPKNVLTLLQRNPTEPIPSKTCFHLALVGFSLLPKEDQYNIVHEKTATYPSLEWWSMVHDLVEQGLSHVAQIAQTWQQEKRNKQEAKQKAKNELDVRKLEKIRQMRIKEDENEKQRVQVHYKKEMLNSLTIPDPSTVQFQEFLRDIVFGKYKGDDPYPVYPYYIRLPEGYQVVRPNATSKTKVFDVQAMLKDSADPNASDGCKTTITYLQPHQAVVNAMMQLRASGYIRTPGLLAMHSTGAGKTLLTLCAMIAFWNLEALPQKPQPPPSRDDLITKPIPIFIVSVKSNQQDNGLQKLAQYGMTFFEEFEDLTVPVVSPFRHPFNIKSYPEFVATFEKLRSAKFNLFLQSKFETTATNSNGSSTIVGKDIANEEDRQKVFESFLSHDQPYEPLKMGKTTYRLLETEPTLFIDVRAEPIFQDLVATRISARLKLGFEKAVASSANDKLQKLKTRGRDLYTFETIGHDLKDDIYTHHVRGKATLMKDAVFVIDEAHYMNLPYKKGDASDAYEYLRTFVQSRRDPHTTWCLAMTATPGERKEHIAAIMKAVGTTSVMGKFQNDTAFVDSPQFTERIRGLVSYAQLYGDFSHFAKIHPYLYCVPLDSSSSYHKLYRKSLCKIKQFHDMNQGELDLCAKEKPNENLEKEFVYDSVQKGVYYKYLRLRSNFVKTKVYSERRGGSPTEKRTRKKPDFFTFNTASFGSDEMDDHLALEDDVIMQGDTTSLKFTSGDEGQTQYSYTYYVSPKLQAVLNNILSLPRGKHFVYAKDKETVGVLAKLLVMHGIDVLLPKKKSDAKQWIFNNDGQTKKPRFIMLDNIVSSKEHLKGLAYKRGNVPLTGKEFVERKEANKRRANSIDNKDGEEVKVILATGENFKGVDFNHLKYLHLVDAMSDFQDFIQFVGRGSRYCSHKLWRQMTARKVNIFLYHLTSIKEDIPGNLMSDPIVWEDSKQRYYEQWGDVEQKLQEASVDYLVFKDTIHANTKMIQESLQNVVCMPTPTIQPPKPAKHAKPAKPAKHAKHTKKHVVDKQKMRDKARRQRVKLGIIV